ncbi:MAG: hypothetical protein WDW38_011153 [Sanguina aurantia]
MQADDEGVAQAEEQMKALAVEDEEELSLDLGKKKKKKKKEVVILDEDEGPDPFAEEGAAPAASPADAAEEDELSLDLNSKKKKKKKKVGGLSGEGQGSWDHCTCRGLVFVEARKEELDFEEGEGGEEGLAAGGGEDEEKGKAGSFPWSGSDREYTHEELLERVFGILRDKNPELTGERRRTVLKPPQVAREGTKKTAFTNFIDLCKAMNRQNEHVCAYLMAELGTSGSLDGQSRLIVKGRFLPKSFETVLRRYVNEYVLCPGCKSVDTLLDRDSATRLMHLRCQQCGASRSVQAIKSGFVARVTRRVQTA